MDEEKIQQELQLMLLTEKIVRDRPHRIRSGSELVRHSLLKFGSEQFFLLLVDVVDYVHVENQPRLPRSGPALDRVILTTVVESLGGNFSGYPFISDGDYFLLVNLRERIEPDAERTSACLGELVVQCRNAVRRIQRYGIQAHIFVSRLIPELESLRKHFSYFRHSVYRGTLPGPAQEVIAVTHIGPMMADADQATRNRIAVCERKIMECALQQDFAGIQRAFSRLIDLEAAIYPRALSMNDRAASRIECLFGVLNVPYFSDRYPFLRVSDCLESVREVLTPAELKDTVCRIIEDFRVSCTPSVRPIEVRVDEISAYIQTHYADPDLCVDQLCRLFHISMSYLSTVYKEKTGAKLLDYIHQCRLERAKELLTQSERTVDAVAAETGYNSTLTLTRAFKRYIGVTPGRYRMERLVAPGEPSNF